MKRAAFRVISVFALVAAVSMSAGAVGQAGSHEDSDERKVLDALQTISSHPLCGYVKELVSEKYGGRLTGTPESPGESNTCR